VANSCAFCRRRWPLCSFSSQCLYSNVRAVVWIVWARLARRGTLICVHHAHEHTLRTQSTAPRRHQRRQQACQGPMEATRGRR